MILLSGVLAIIMISILVSELLRWAWINLDGLVWGYWRREGKQIFYYPTGYPRIRERSFKGLKKPQKEEVIIEPKTRYGC